MLRGDVDTDLFSQHAPDIQQASEEKGLPLQDEFVVAEGPEMATLSLQVLTLSL